MSHQTEITQPPAARWVSWYAPELSAALILGTLVPAFTTPAGAALAVVPAAALAAQETRRAIRATAVRRATRPGQQDEEVATS